MWPIFTIVAAYLTLLGSIGAVTLSFKRDRRMVVGTCSACAYPLEGLEGAPRCPECGLAREEMKPAHSLGWWWIQAIAAALLGPSIVASLAATMTLVLRPIDEIPIATGLATAPYGVILVMVLTTHRPQRLRRSVQFSCMPALACAPFLVLVMYVYWTNPVDGGDYGWPITDVALFSVLCFAIFVVMWLAWMVIWAGSRVASLLRNATETGR